MSDEAQRYYSKMPENRKKELRRMCRLSALMEERGATKSELDRVTMYISYVAQLRNHTYSPMRHEYGIDILMTKYYDKYYKVSENDVALYTYLISELMGGVRHGESIRKG